jgi:hypothetical protein
MQVSTYEPRKPVRYYGSIDHFVPPRALAGWVKGENYTGNGSDIVVSVYDHDRLIAKGSPSFMRFEDTPYLTGFRLFCNTDIADEAVVFETLRIEVTDIEGGFGQLDIWDVTRGFAASRLKDAAPAPGLALSSALLNWIGRSERLAKPVREAILEIHDRHFDTENQKLMYQFESLGKDCSVGAIQRAYGAEPLGLFRFTGISAPSVIEAIRSRFQGIGAPEFTVLKSGVDGEYFTEDTRFYMRSHTYVFAGNVEIDLLLKQQCKKISFLVRNLLEKLLANEKIFIVHAIPADIPKEILVELFSVLRNAGSSKLLYVRLPNDGHEAGDVIMREDGILEGYALQFQSAEIVFTQEIREGWLRLFQNAAMTAKRS